MQPVRKVGRQHDDVGAIGAVGGRRVDRIIGTPAARAAAITGTQASSIGRIAALRARSDGASATGRRRTGSVLRGIHQCVRVRESRPGAKSRIKWDDKGDSQGGPALLD
jgi:hypothetical protein